MLNHNDDLILRIKGGDQSALKQWCDTYLDRLYAFIYYRTGKNQNDAEDLLQETILSAWEGLETFENSASFYTWMCGIAKNKISNFLRSKQKLTSLEALMENVEKKLYNLIGAIEQRPISQEEVNNQETKDLVNVAISSLPPHYQNTLIDKYCHNLSMEVIAQRMNLSFKAVESILARARAAFKETFILLSRERELSNEQP